VADELADDEKEVLGLAGREAADVHGWVHDLRVALEVLRDPLA
jgi:hypothetical protein